MGHQLVRGLLDPEFLDVFLGLMTAGFLLGGLFGGLSHLRARYPQDDQIGLKTLFEFFCSLGLLVLLVGLSLIVSEVLNDGFDLEAMDPSATVRDGMALTCAGLVFGCLHWFLLSRGTSRAARDGVRRFYLGWRLAIHGFVLFACAAIVLRALMQRSPRSWEVRVDLRRSEIACYGIMVVWGVSWLLHVFLYWWHTPRAQPSGPTWESSE